MNKLRTIFKTFVDPDVNDMREAHFLSGDLERTDEGTDVLLDILFLEKKAQMVAKAREKLNIKKEEEKKSE